MKWEYFMLPDERYSFQQEFCQVYTFGGCRAIKYKLTIYAFQKDRIPISMILQSVTYLFFGFLMFPKTYTLHRFLSSILTTNSKLEVKQYAHGLMELESKSQRINTWGPKGFPCSQFRAYSPSFVDRIWLRAYYNKIPISPIFYLLTGDYNTIKNSSNIEGKITGIVWGYTTLQFCSANWGRMLVIVSTSTLESYTVCMYSG